MSFIPTDTVSAILCKTVNNVCVCVCVENVHKSIGVSCCCFSRLRLALKEKKDRGVERGSRNWKQTEEKLHKSRLFGVRFAHLHFFFFFSLLCADCAIFEPLLCYLLLFVLFCCVSFSASLGFCISHSKVLINFSFDQFNKFLVVCQLKLNLCVWL